ncbi:hypothetical protein OG225_40745 (plasmid) [Nocardia sp. NBC_01377]|uniref:hypothetical protein n=1 Tax=Nocardia sp. NBC_01377 TaxID=2903595 RepID=UPI002F91B764
MRADDNSEPEDDNPETHQGIAIPRRITDFDSNSEADPDATVVIMLPQQAFDDGVVLDVDVVVEGELTDVESDGADGRPVPLLSRWQRFVRTVGKDVLRRHLPYAAVAAVVVSVGVGLWIITAGPSENSETVGDAAASAELATQSFDDITALIPGDYTPTELVPTAPSSMSEIPSEVALPGQDMSAEFGVAEDPTVPGVVTVTETAPAESIGDPVVVETVTQTPTESGVPSTVTETSTAQQWPSVSLNGSVSMPPVTIPQGTGAPQIVVVQPSTVTVTVPAETTSTTAGQSPPKSAVPRTTTARPSVCRTPAATDKPKARTTTASPASTTQSVHPSTPTTPKKSSSTTTVRPCK